MNDKTGKKCYMYLRVSTYMQVDGYSLDAQMNKIKSYADANGMIISGVYRDEGKSGKNIEGRPEFQKMMKDIENRKDNVSFVLVFKLSRFGRNVTDTMNSLERIQGYGVELVSVDEGLDTSTSMGKLVIVILSAVAEMERENIIAQSKAGREQKAKEGKWNGGVAPYGYKLGDDGVLEIDEETSEIVQYIFHEYAYTAKGINAIAKELNQRGIKKEIRTEYNVEEFSKSFIKRLLCNQTYIGKIVYGKYKTKLIEGSKEYKRRPSDDYIVVDGKHEALIDRGTWDAVQKRLNDNKESYKTKSDNTVNCLLTGLLKCPVCGSNFNTNSSSSRKKKSGEVVVYRYYVCQQKKRFDIPEQKCTYGKQLRKEKIEKEVEDVIFMLVHDKDFADKIKEKIGTEIDTTEIDKLISDYEKQLQKINNNIHRWEDKLNELDIEDKHYDKRVESYENQITKLYDQVDEVESKIKESKERRRGIEMQAITADNVYKYLLYFDKIYYQLPNAEKKQFLGSFIEAVHIYPEKREDGKFLKSIDFKFPIYYNGVEQTSLFLGDTNGRQDKCFYYPKSKPDNYVRISINLGEFVLPKTIS